MKVIQKIFNTFIYMSIGLVIISLGIIIFFMLKRGLHIISWEFLTSPPRKAMTEGGIAPAIVGTFYLTLGSVIFALPLGIGCAIYLSEYSPKGFIVNLIRISINNLAGVPSIIFGLFGLAVFVKFLGFGVSILSGCLTLGIMILPGLISASYESLISVPQSLREASFALGATHFQTIRKVVLPSALPGILTGLIINIGRCAGETAPILLTAATFYKRGYPTSIFSEVMALPYHIYALMTEGTFPEKQTSIAYGCSLVLLLLVLTVSSVAIYIRQKQRRYQRYG